MYLAEDTNHICFKYNFRIILVVFGICGFVFPAKAEVQEYQIKRIILYKSNCKFISLQYEQLEDNAVQYKSECENVAFYPDGITVLCSDRDDERSCRVLEKEQAFDNLQMLQ